jgi:hypothetical protein
MAMSFSHTKLGAVVITTTVLLSCAANARAHGGAAHGADAGTTSSASSETTQTLWQIQVSGCTEHCRGTSQTQVAVQENTTTQATVPVAGTAEPARGDGSSTPSGVTTGSNPRPSGGAPLINGPPAHGGAPLTERPPARGGASASTTKRRRARTIRQIQLGCVSHCFGSTRMTSASASSDKRVIDQILGASRLLALGAVEQRGATQQSAVHQASAQVQEGTRSAPAQSQIVVQTNTASQRSSGAAGGATSGVVQRIWQLQIGCLRWCVNTHQRQRAGQVSTTTSRRFPAVGARGVSHAGPADHTHQLIWQVQIGCIAWCFRATEHQAASQRDRKARVRATHVHPAAPPERAAASPETLTLTSVPAPPPEPAKVQHSAGSPRRRAVHGRVARRAPQPQPSRSAYRVSRAPRWQLPISAAAGHLATSGWPDEAIIAAILGLIAAFAAAFFALRPRLGGVRR